MAFCMKCGRPLPESGVCECSQPVQQPYYGQMNVQPNYQQTGYQQQPQQAYPQFNQMGQQMLKQGYTGDLSSREAGSVGGQMVKKMIEAYEQGLQ